MRNGSGGAGFTANGQVRASRAAQFMPFAALTGYYELTRQQERTIEPRHELTDEEALALSQALTRLTRGNRVRARYYDTDAYREITGIVTAIDPILRTLRIIRTDIPFDNLRDLTILESDQDSSA